jgi:hypothetical protein
MNEQTIDWLTQAVDRLNATMTQLAELMAASMWTCGCGHVNGANLANCAVCRRDPAGRDPN